jgi:hypothetical protein
MRKEAEAIKRQAAGLRIWKAYLETIKGNTITESEE